MSAPKARAETRRTPAASTQRLRIASATVLGLLAAVLAIGLLGCAAAKPNTVSIHDLQFDPHSMPVAKGTTVTWVNNDEAAHTITTDDFGTKGAAPGQFSSDPLNPGDSFTHTFDTVGTFNYHCTIHPYIKGTIIVQ